MYLLLLVTDIQSSLYIYYFYLGSCGKIIKYVDYILSHCELCCYYYYSHNFCYLYLFVRCEPWSRNLTRIVEDPRFYRQCGYF